MSKEQPHRLQNTHILIVDDNEAILTTLGILLRAHGLRVSTSSTGDIQPRLVGEERPDVILLDLWIQSSTSGKDVCRAVKADNNTSDIAVVIMSANTDIQEVAYEAGADAYITKPFAVTELLEVLAGCVGAVARQDTRGNSKKHTRARYEPRTSWYFARLAGSHET